jgi:hypothetical protein
LTLGGAAQAHSGRRKQLLRVLTELPVYESAAVAPQVERQQAQQVQQLEQREQQPRGDDPQLEGGQQQHLQQTPGGQAGAPTDDPPTVDEDDEGAVVYVDLVGPVFLEPPGFDVSPMLACHRGAATAPKYVRF